MSSSYFPVDSCASSIKRNSLSQQPSSKSSSLKKLEKRLSRKIAKKSDDHVSECLPSAASNEDKPTDITTKNVNEITEATGAQEKGAPSNQIAAGDAYSSEYYQFIEEAIKELVKTRWILQCSYVYGYYLGEFTLDWQPMSNGSCIIPYYFYSPC